MRWYADLAVWGGGWVLAMALYLWVNGCSTMPACRPMAPGLAAADSVASWDGVSDAPMLDGLPECEVR